MDKTALQVGDVVAVRDSGCTHNVYRGSVVGLFDGRFGIWVAVNYKNSWLSGRASKREHTVSMVKLNGKDIIGHWTPYQDKINKAREDSVKLKEEMNLISIRAEKVARVLGNSGIESRSNLDYITISLADMERLLAERITDEQTD